jgi:heptaprenyl diphosphate synthase
MLSNGVQLLLARFFVFGADLRFLVPPFLASGFVSGIALGIFCEVFCGRSRWYSRHAKAGARQPAGETRRTTVEIRMAVPETRKTSAGARCLRRRQRWNGLFGSTELFIAGLVMMMLLVFNPSPLLRVPQFLFFCFLAWFSGKRNNPFITASLMLCIVFFNLLAPHGKIIAALGPFKITGGSLLSGLGKAFTLEGLVMLSGACVKTDLKLPGRLGSLLGESFRLLELMRGWKMTIRRGHVIEGIDRLMLELDAAAGIEAASSVADAERVPLDAGKTKAGESGAENTPKRRFRALLPLAAMIVLTGLPLLFLHYT